MDKALPIGDTFGNYWIKGIAEIRHPDAVAWTPAAPGWMAVALVFCGVILWLLIHFFRRWRRNAYRRRALAKFRRLQKQSVFDETAFLQELPRLLKETAIRACPESDAASLTGIKWLAFLENQAPGTGFGGDMGRHLAVIAYQDPRKWAITAGEARQLGIMVKHWIMQHRIGDRHA